MLNVKVLTEKNNSLQKYIYIYFFIQKNCFVPKLKNIFHVKYCNQSLKG